MATNELHFFVVAFIAFDEARKWCRGAGATAMSILTTANRSERLPKYSKTSFRPKEVNMLSYRYVV